METFTPQMLRDIIALKGPIDLFEIRACVNERVNGITHNKVMLYILNLEEQGEIVHNSKTGTWTAKVKL